MKPDDREKFYDYKTAGFDSFLSRSIDGFQQNNLDADGPNSTALRYDSAQVSGLLGDRIQIGNITIDGVDGSIKVSDGENTVVLIGNLGD